MTRLQRALQELSEAMGNRPWILAFDPCDPDSEEWGFATEHSRHPAYVRMGLLRAAVAMADHRFVTGGRVGPPLSKRGQVPAAPLKHSADELGRCDVCGLDLRWADNPEGPCPGYKP